MAKVIIEAINTPSLWHWGGTVAYMDIYANQPFETYNGQTIFPGQLKVQDAYLRVVCEIQSGNIFYAPSLEIDSTLDSPTNANARYSAVIRDVRNSIKVRGWPGGLGSWAVTNDASQTWEDIITRNAVATLNWPPPSTYPTQVQIQAMIDAALGARDFASETRVGVTALDEDPIDPAFPIALSASSTKIAQDTGTDTLVAALPTTVASSAVTPTSIILALSMDAGITGRLKENVGNRVDGVSFEIESDNGADAGTFGFILWNPA